MNNKKLTVIVFALLLIYTTSSSAAPTNLPNLLANPGFESGTSMPLNWSLVTVDGNTPLWDTVSHSGTRSVKINIPGTKDSESGYPKSDLIKTEPFQNYILFAWVKTQDAGGTYSPALRVVELDSNKKWLRQTNLAFSKGTNDWTQKQITFQTGADTRWVYIYAAIRGGYGTFWVDDIELSQFSSILNLMANPGFESGTTKPLNWSFVTVNGNTPLWDTVSHSGTRSVKINIPGTKDSESGYPKSDLIKTEPFQNYILSAWVKTQDAGGTYSPALRVVELDSNKKWLRQTNLAFSKGTNDWTQKQITFQTGADTRWIYVYAAIRGGYGTFWVDDIELGPSISYIIYSENNKTYAINGRNGVIEYSDTDASTVIQKAINALNPIRTWKETIVLRGNFTLSTIMSVPSWTTIYARDAIINVKDSAFIRFNNVNYSDFIGGIIDGNLQTNGEKSNRVMVLSNTSYIKILDVEIRNGGYYGLNIWQGNNNTFDSVWSHHNYRHGIHIGSDAIGKGYGNVFINCRAEYNGQAGIADRGSTVENNLYNSYINCVTNNNTNYGLSLEMPFSNIGKYSITVINHTSEHNGKDGILLSFVEAKIMNPIIRYNSGSGILMQGVQNSYISDPIINNNKKVSYYAGIRIVDRYSLASKNISVVGGDVKRNWRNLYVTYSAVPNSDIAFKNIDATDGVDSNIYIAGGQANITMVNVRS